MIDVSAGLSDSIHKPIDASYYPDGWRRYMARAIKEVFPDKIVMTSGNIRNPQSACEILENQDADLIGMGRQTIANPSWSHKVKTGKIDEIRLQTFTYNIWVTLICHHALCCYSFRNATTFGTAVFKLFFCCRRRLAIQFNQILSASSLVEPIICRLSFCNGNRSCSG